MMLMSLRWLETDSHLLTASQVDQVEFSCEFVRRVHVLLFDVDEEDAVATGAVLVHISLTHTHTIYTYNTATIQTTR